MRIVFLYAAKGQAAPDSSIKWDREKKATNLFVAPLPVEGYYVLLQELITLGVVDEVMIIIESTSGMGRFQYTPKIYGYVTPRIGDIKEYLRDGDVIWSRGGWRTWFPFLTWAQEQKIWTLCYAANTGRDKWKFWDIVFNDLNANQFVDRLGRFHYHFKKPTNEKVFFLRQIEREYDVCIGASHIHDKKGQWLSLKVAIEYKAIFGKDLKCIMPGSLQRGVKSNYIIQDIAENGLDVALPGMVSRLELGKIFNRSKVFTHLGGGGQNDRGPLEAMCCGTPLVMNTPHRHAPFTYSDKRTTLVLDPGDPPSLMARKLHDFMERDDNDLREYVAYFYRENSGFHTVVVPEMIRLYSFLREHIKVDREALWKEYDVTPG